MAENSELHVNFDVSARQAEQHNVRQGCMTGEKLNCREFHIIRVGQNRIYTPYMTVYLVLSLPKIPYIRRIYMVLPNPTYKLKCIGEASRAAGSTKQGLTGDTFNQAWWLFQFYYTYSSRLFFLRFYLVPIG
jgi:hypothetical protein